MITANYNVLIDHAFAYAKNTIHAMGSMPITVVTESQQNNLVIPLACNNPEELIKQLRVIANNLKDKKPAHILFISESILTQKATVKKGIKLPKGLKTSNKIISLIAFSPEGVRGYLGTYTRKDDTITYTEIYRDSGPLNESVIATLLPVLYTGTC